MSIVRIGLAETKNFAEGYEAIFGKKKDDKKPAETAPPADQAKKAESKDEPKSDKPSDVKPGVTVTELPVEEVNPEAPPADDNK